MRGWTAVSEKTPRHGIYTISPPGGPEMEGAAGSYICCMDRSFPAAFDY